MKIRKRYLALGIVGIGAAVYLRGKRPQHVIADLMLELPTRGRSLEQQVQSLERSGKALSGRLQTLPDTPENREQLRHIITLERWGTQRLRVFAGAAFEKDRSSLYRPEEHLEWDELREEFADARAELLEVVRSLHDAPAGEEVEHNSFGPLSKAGWIRYLDTHAALESRKLKG